MAKRIKTKIVSKTGKDGLQSLAVKLKGVGEDKSKSIEDLLAKGAVEIQNEARRSIQKGPKTGETRTLSNPDRVHTASAPGEAPASDRGRLVESINLKKDGANSTYTIGVHREEAVSYAAYLEFGTQNIKRRPFLRPAYNKVLPKLRRALKRI